MHMKTLYRGCRLPQKAPAERAAHLKIDGAWGVGYTDAIDSRQRHRTRVPQAVPPSPSFPLESPSAPPMHAWRPFVEYFHVNPTRLMVLAKHIHCSGTYPPPCQHRTR